MGTPITANPTPTYSNTVTGPSDGIGAVVDDVNIPFQQLLDNDAEIRAQKGVANGVATLDVAGKLVEIPPNHIVSRADVIDANDATTVGAGLWVDVAGSSISLGALELGDIVEVEAAGIISNESAAGTGGQARIVVNDGAVDYATPYIAWALPGAITGGTIPTTLALVWRHTVQTAGAVSVRLQHASDGSHSVRTRANVLARAVRP